MENNKENIISKLKTKETAYSIAGIYIFLILITLILLYNHGSLFAGKIDPLSSMSNNGIGVTIFATIFFTLISIALVILLLPNFQNIEKFLQQMNKVVYVILYTIFLFLFFRLIPNETLNQYAYIFTPITLVGTIYLFTQAIQKDYISEFDVNYERIKMIVLFFCLITIFIIYYSVDPGGYIQRNFGYSFLLTILLSIFSFLYLFIVLTLQGKREGKTNMKGGGNSENIFNRLGENHLFLWFTNTFFVLFIILLGIGVYMYPNGFFSNTGVSTSVIIFSLLIFIIWGSSLTITYSPDITNKILDDLQMNLFKKLLLIILGVIISGLIIGWLAYNMQSISGGETSTFSLILNVLLALVVLTFIYKIIEVKPPAKTSKNSRIYDLLDIFKNILFYIPCLFSDLFDFVSGFFVNEYNNTTTKNLYFFVFSILLFVFYYLFFFLKNNFLLQGGKRLVNEPINTENFHSIAGYQELNNINANSNNTSVEESYQYQYGISCWIYIDSMPPNTNASYSKYTSLLNYGNKPNILYNAQKNTLIITMDKGTTTTDEGTTTTDEGTTTTDEGTTTTDEDNNKLQVVYKKENYLLQKWNQFIMNYYGGTLDIFMNGELVKSVNGAVPYMSLDTLTVGSNNGIRGGICNLLYFKQPLTSANIYYLYHTVKDKKIPVS